MRPAILALLVLLSDGAPAAASPEAALPVRVVSLNLCTDEYLVLLAPEKVAALTVLARDPSLSVVAAAARALPWVRADAESVLRLHPDLVLAGPWGAQTTLALLERRGLRVERTALPVDFVGIEAETMRIAVMLGVPSRGAAIVAAMRTRLAAIPARAGGLRALALEPRGWTAGPGSLTDAVMRAAGLEDGGSGRQVGLEALATHPPDLLVVSEMPGFPSLATDMLAHPALREIPRRSLPPALLACGGPWSVEAVEALAR